MNKFSLASGLAVRAEQFHPDFFGGFPAMLSLGMVLTYSIVLGTVYTALQ